MDAHDEAQLKALKTEREFLEAYDTHADALFRHAFVRLRDREAARDVVQEAFSRMWLYVAEGKKVDYMRAFLYRIVNNLIVDTVRKRRTSSLDAMMDDDGFEPRDEHAPDVAVVPEGRAALALLGRLDERYRTTVTMRFLDGLSPKEIAAILKVSENVVSVRIHRGIEKLRAMANSTRDAITPAPKKT